MIRRVGISLSLVVVLGLLALVFPASAQAPTIMVGDSATHGKILVDSKGMTLYAFTKDGPNVSNCTGQCLAAWPPLLLAAGEPIKGDGISGTVSTITLADGTRQVTLNDMPLYYWAGDTQPGDATGYGVNNLWYTVHPDAPSVKVSDQALKGNTVTITSVAAAEPGWLVIHANADGKPGTVIGYTPVVPGWNGDVMVTIDTSMATQHLFAMLHVDRGAMDTYEFPGADAPVTVGGVTVSPAFFVTGLPVGGGATPDATAKVKATVEPTAAAGYGEVATAAPTAIAVAAEATQAPAATAAPLLPTTGGAASALPLAAAALGGLAVAGGILFSKLRR